MSFYKKSTDIFTSCLTIKVLTEVKLGYGAFLCSRIMLLDPTEGNSSINMSKIAQGKAKHGEIESLGC